MPWATAEGRVLLVSNDVKDRARPLEYKGHGVLADIDLAQIVEVLVSHGEQTQPLAVGWDNAPIVQKDDTKVDVALCDSRLAAAGANRSRDGS